jgi:transcriptional regulator with XRE-family HTH domain
MGDLRNPIKDARLAKGWRKTDLAKQTNLSPRTIDRAENGAEISEATKHKIAIALNMQVGDLFPIVDRL